MALDGIAKVLLSSGDNETVIAQLAALPLDENLSIDLATAYRQTGQLDDAARVLKDSLKTHPDSGALTSALVSIYSKQLRLTEAEKIAEQLARRHPDYIEAQRVYLQVMVFNAENEAAMPLARKLLSQAPHDADFLYLNGVLERAAGAQMLTRMFALAIRGISEPDCRRSIEASRPIIANIGPQPRDLGLAHAGSEHRDRCIVGMNLGCGQQTNHALGAAHATDLLYTSTTSIPTVNGLRRATPRCTSWRGRGPAVSRLLRT